MLLIPAALLGEAWQTCALIALLQLKYNPCLHVNFIYMFKGRNNVDNIKHIYFISSVHIFGQLCLLKK